MVDGQRNIKISNFFLLQYLYILHTHNIMCCILHAACYKCFLPATLRKSRKWHKDFKHLQLTIQIVLYDWYFMSVVVYCIPLLWLLQQQ